MSWMQLIEPAVMIRRETGGEDGSAVAVETLDKNVLRTMANSPAALRGYLALFEAMSAGILSARLREQIALAVSEANMCQYCVAAHTVAGRRVGLEEAEIRAAREAQAADARVEAALRFARRVVEYRGDLTDEEFEAVRRAGFSDGEIAEIIATVVLTIYTNYFNMVAQTEIDFSV
jgi:uncharacterized peroxidase-related enzyme